MCAAREVGQDPASWRLGLVDVDLDPGAGVSRVAGNFIRLSVEAPHRTIAETVLDRRVLTVSLGTLPRPDGADLRRKLREIRDVFDFVKFGDNPRARARVSPWAAAAVALGQGLEPIVHVGCRDRNRLALQSDLLGGRLLGVRNVLCLRGDEIEVSDQPDAGAVRDLDVVDLIGLAAEDFCVLAACDPAVEMNDEHAARLRTKIAAGAQLLETQPVFEPDGFARWLRDLREAGIDVPVLVDVSVVTRRPRPSCSIASRTWLPRRTSPPAWDGIRAPGSRSPPSSSRAWSSSTAWPAATSPSSAAIPPRRWPCSSALGERRRHRSAAATSRPPAHIEEQACDPSRDYRPAANGRPTDRPNRVLRPRPVRP